MPYEVSSFVWYTPNDGSKGEDGEPLKILALVTGERNGKNSVFVYDHKGAYYDTEVGHEPQTDDERKAFKGRGWISAK